MTNTEIPRAKLHTDELEEKYGKVTARVFEHSDRRRIVDIVDRLEICRTHALTIFPDNYSEGNDDWDRARSEIADGELIGKTIRKYGFGIEKRSIIEGMTRIPDWLQERFEVEDKQAKVRGYEFVVLDSDKQLIDVYGLIFEIDSPDFTGEVTDLNLTTLGDGLVFRGEDAIMLLINYLKVR